MKILLVGGGSGGHITPLLAVAEQIKKESPRAVVIAVTERFGRFNHLLEGEPSIDMQKHVFAGKLRRYHNESWLKRSTDLWTLLLNLRDLFLLAIGIAESLFFLITRRPDIIFIKGGYVGIPIGIASRILRIPYITHDSDASAGLTNRIIGPGAVLNAVGMPPEFYRYKPSKIVHTGVPVRKEYKTFSGENYAASRERLGIKKDEFLIVVAGGSNGAQRIDKIMQSSLGDVMKKNTKLRVIHQVGKGNANIYKGFPEEVRPRIMVERFLTPFVNFIGAADLIVTRAGATVITELASLEKPALLIPHPELTGGHQIQNAKLLSEKKAVFVLDEKQALNDPKKAVQALNELIESSELRKKLAQNLHKNVPSDAANKISKLLISQR